jgi:hypothetical protein
LNSTQGFKFNRRFKSFPRLEFNKEDFEILSEIDLGSEMKFESSDLNPNKRYLNSRQGFELKEFPNSKRFKTF